MQFTAAFVLTLCAASALADVFEPMENFEIDWSNVVPVQEMPGFWVGREIQPQTIDSKTRSRRIVGGVEVTPHTHPYQVALLSNFGTVTSLCGGSRISSRTVLTAAHCPIGSQSTQMIFGAHSIVTVEPNQFRQTVAPAQYRLHPQYNPSNLNNDIALIITTSVIPSNQFIQDIPLAPADSGSFAGAAALVSGWGRTSDSSSATSPVLRSVTTTVITNAECQAVYGGIVIPSTLCISTTGGRGVCNSDSGGPLT